MTEFPGLPEFLKLPMAVAGYRARIAMQRPHQELTFQSVLVAREKYKQSQASFKEKIDWLIPRVGMDESVREMIYTNAALRALYEDLGATLILLAAASIERLYRSVGVSLFDRGACSYVGSISFVRAVQGLANQYKHWGEWTHGGPRNEEDVRVIAELVDNPFRTDAASEFLSRSGFEKYEQFEDALLSCSDGIAHPSLLPDGRQGIPTVTLRLLPPE